MLGGRLREQPPAPPSLELQHSGLAWSALLPEDCNTLRMKGLDRPGTLFVRSQAGQAGWAGCQGACKNSKENLHQFRI